MSSDDTALSTSSVSRLNQRFRAALSLPPRAPATPRSLTRPANTMWTALAMHSVAMCSSRASSDALLLDPNPPPEDCALPGDATPNPLVEGELILSVVSPPKPEKTRSTRPRKRTEKNPAAMLSSPSSSSFRLVSVKAPREGSESAGTRPLPLAPPLSPRVRWSSALSTRQGHQSRPSLSSLLSRERKHLDGWSKEALQERLRSPAKTQTGTPRCRPAGACPP
mmetsp:Transcript_14578/g.36841  ORF Transcript_14578/g.36841 Transcript_14578/m.36841 type:complete len:223 (-) Transcript_14578:43-711(-)